MTRWWSVSDITPAWVEEHTGMGRVSRIWIEPIRESPYDLTVRVNALTPTDDHRSVYVKLCQPDYDGPIEPLRRQHVFYTRAREFQLTTVSALVGAMFVPAHRLIWLILSAEGPMELGDDLRGVGDWQGRLAASALAKMHLTLSGRGDGGEHDWIPASTPIPADEVGDRYVEFVERFGERLSVTHLSVANRVVASAEALQDVAARSTSPQGLVHGDFRPANLMFGGPGSARPVTLTQWHQMSWGPMATDVAMLLSCGMTPEERREHGDAVIAVYHEGLGDRAPSMEAMRREVSEQAYVGLLAALCRPRRFTGSATAAPHAAERSDEHALAMFSRACEYLIDMEKAPSRRARVAVARVDPDDEFPHGDPSGLDANETWYHDVVDMSHGVGAYLRLGSGSGRSGGTLSGVICGPSIPTITLLHRGIDMADLSGPDMTVTSENVRYTARVLTALSHTGLSVTGTGQAFADPRDVVVQSGEVPVTVSLDLNFYTSGVAHRSDMIEAYEVPCAVTGTIEVTGPDLHIGPLAINGPGQRSHSWNIADWWSTTWFWFAVHFEDGTYLHGLDVRPHGLTPGSRLHYQPADAPPVQLERCRVIDVVSDEGLITASTIAIEPGSATIGFTTVGHGPLGQRTRSGRVVVVQRAWGTFTRNDGLTGLGWMDWSCPSPTV
ncbi:aminoglycoside phosphotransferase family protein [Williamsia sp. CHRR-6]|uniref:aminoglycoside phosphotransferase family protein n=1 Tax=Williamsia sp. CHRR-6 TaxID=2835871 RepID=UPI001BDB3B33|nr:aminoglycoside phosphotransferase family protein [Williamsia sp. CHRR-6]MBT0567814.1 aminoglycoside phosphotransferase family protein [Williamsia sp. CHRR-6]